MSSEVYVLETGEQCEGSWIVGIYSTYELALAALPHAKEQWICNTSWKLEDEDYWTSGCDFISIVKYIIDEEVS